MTARASAPHTPNRGADLRMLEELEAIAEELSEVEREAFSSMLDYLRTGATNRLSPKQREWCKRVHELHFPTYENMITNGTAPRGREVPTPEVLMHRPLKPPGRK